MVGDDEAGLATAVISAQPDAAIDVLSLHSNSGILLRDVAVRAAAVSCGTGVPHAPGVVAEFFR
jgi:hypothetical protein